MQLSYRGLCYQSNNTTVANFSSDDTAKYRGVSYEISRGTVVQSLTKSELKYRGVSYWRGCS
ncbi:MAG: DUF4278 domain-containing protein [Scytonema sp. PMC 1069.18]|nr:DUF4278 domain-containing protein [Scytonema sp. PMC 1069.18]MEC4887384.1 DUF4278 domain-containing protein [Scytonema sp. PMC 1070.18]